MNSAQFKGQIMTLAELTNKEFTTDAVPRYWWETFGDLPDDVLLQAFAVAKRTSKFFPSPNEFDEIIRQIGRKSGAVVDGATAWDAMQRDLFGCWSETNDRINIRVHGYPWPNDRCKQILRGQLNCTVRDVVEMHPAEYAKTREAFVKAYDGAAQTEQAEATVAKIAAPAPLSVVAPPPLRRISGGGE
jgi:hypothetical protein